MIIFADNINFKKQNFKALFDYLDGNKITYSYDSHRNDLKKSWGDYCEQEINIERSFETFLSENYRGINLYDICEQEIIQFLSVDFHKDENCIPFCRNDRANYLYEKFNYNFNAFQEIAIFWIDHWYNRIENLSPKIGIVFGGSLIYAQAFSKVFEQNKIPVFVTEHFFTGNHFYFEKRYNFLPNNSILKSKKYCEKLLEKNEVDDIYVYENALFYNNKNVKQPTYSSILSSGYCLLITQVCNDFAISSLTNRFKNSIKFYCEFIDKFLEETTESLVIKTHPYEKSKNIENRSITFEELSDYVMTNHPEKIERVLFYEDHSLPGLIDGANYVVTLNSQSGLEAAMRGKPVVCFGGPFYGGKGFTLDLDSLDKFFSDYMPMNPAFCHEKHVLLMDFMKSTFTHLVEMHAIKKVENYILLSGVPLSALKVAAKKHSVSQSNLSSDFKHKLKHAEPVIAETKKPILSPPAIESRTQKNNKALRKFKKLKNNPIKFFADSRFSILRTIARRIQ